MAGFLVGSSTASARLMGSVLQRSRVYHSRGPKVDLRVRRATRSARVRIQGAGRAPSSVEAARHPQPPSVPPLPPLPPPPLGPPLPALPTSMVAPPAPLFAPLPEDVVAGASPST